MLQDASRKRDSKCTTPSSRHIAKATDRKTGAAPSISNGALLRSLQASDSGLERSADSIAVAVTRGRAGNHPGGHLCSYVSDNGGGAIAAAHRSGPTIRSVVGSGHGKPLARAARARIEPAVGRALADVRVHDDNPAHVAAASVGARAFTNSNDIYLGCGQTTADLGLLAHESAHVVQQAAGNASGLIQCQPDPHTAGVASSGLVEPLMRYTRLRAALSADQWQALNAAARQRVRSQLGAGDTRSPGDDEQIAVTTVDVAVCRLLEPPLQQEEQQMSGQWLNDLYTGAMQSLRAGSPDQVAMGEGIKREMVARWVQRNEQALGSTVSVSLIDPQGLTGGISTLTFQLMGSPVQSFDGSLTFADVDALHNRDLPDIVDEIRPDLEDLQRALEATHRAESILTAARRLSSQDDEALAAAAIEQAHIELGAAIGNLESADFGLQSQMNVLRAEAVAYRDGPLSERMRAHHLWREEHLPRPPLSLASQRRFNEALESQRRSNERGGWTAIAGAYTGRAMEAHATTAVLSGMFTPGSSEAYQLLEQGRISLDTYRDVQEEIRTRGIIVGAITAAVALATFGLGFYLAPVTLGGQVLLYGSLGLAETLIPMAAQHYYTRSVRFDDPAAQAIWSMGQFSGSQFATAGGIGAGIGMAVPIAGRLLSRFGSRSSAIALIESAQAGQLIDVEPGLVARRVGEAVEIAIPDEQMVLRFTREGWQLHGPAGPNASVVLGEGVWGPASVGEGVMGTAVIPGRTPGVLGVSEQGWGLLSPRSQIQRQFGLWGPYAPAGAGSGYSGAGPIINLTEGSTALAFPTPMGAQSMLASGTTLALPEGPSIRTIVSGGINTTPGPLVPTPANPLGLTTNCGFCSISWGLARVSPGIAVPTADQLFIDTLVDLGLPTSDPADPISRMLVFPERTNYSGLGRHPEYEALFTGEGNRVSQYTLPHVAGQRGLALDPASDTLAMWQQAFGNRSAAQAAQARHARLADLFEEGQIPRLPDLSAVQRWVSGQRLAVAGDYIIGSRRGQHYMNMTIDNNGVVRGIDWQDGRTYLGIDAIQGKLGGPMDYIARINPGASTGYVPRTPTQ